LPTSGSHHDFTALPEPWHPDVTVGRWAPELRLIPLRPPTTNTFTTTVVVRIRLSLTHILTLHHLRFNKMLLLYLLYPLLALASPVAKPPANPKPCTLHSPTTGSFFDLTSISLHPPSSKKDSERQKSWHARGYDYGANFTLNICAPVIEDLAEMGGVKGVEEGRWANVSAYYEYDGERFSIGCVAFSPSPLAEKKDIEIRNTPLQQSC
jgi:hypothetical protein